MTIPRSHRLGFCNPNGHITVCQTGVFFLSQFASEHQRPYHSLTDQVFLTPVAIPLSVGPVSFFLIILTGTSVTIPQSHRPGPWYGHWRPRSKKGLKNRYVRPWYSHWRFGKKWLKKWKKTRSERPRYGHCQTGSKTWKPASVVHKTSPYWWMADAVVRTVAFPIAANTMAQNRRGQFRIFFFLTSASDVRRHQERKKTEFATFPFHVLVYLRQSGDLEGKNFLKSEFAFFRSTPSYLQRSGRQKF